jgi:hypothetical protein
MTAPLRRALLWGVGIAVYLRFGLEPTGWLFYEASHALDVAGLYWGYSVFRGAGYGLGLWGYQSLACALVGTLIGLLVYWRASRKESL